MKKTKAFNYGSNRGEIEIHRETERSYTVGDLSSMKVLIGDQMVRGYADQYGDHNPIHLDDQAGRESLFKARIAHGMLSFNFFSTLLGAGFPGPGTIFTGVQDWRFTAPVKIGDELALEVKVASAREKSSGAYDLVFEARAIKNDGTSVMSGKLSVIAPKPFD
jgi:3-hydroxybutyryl-CoA dehydratase